MFGNGQKGQDGEEMKKLKTVAGILFSAAFVGLGIWGLFYAESVSQKIVFAACAAFFGGGLAIELVDLLPPAKPVETPNGDLIVRTSFLRVIVLGLGCLGFMVAGGVLALSGWQASSGLLMAIGGAGVMFGGVFCLFLVRRMSAGGTEYVINSSGVESRTGIRWQLAWSDIQAVGVGGVAQNFFIVLETYSGVPDPQGFVSKFNRRFGMPPYAIGSSTNGVDIHGLADRLYDMIEAAQSQGSDT